MTSSPSPIVAMIAKNMIGLAPGVTTTSSGRDGDAARLGDVLGDGLAKLRQARGRAVVRRCPQVERLLRRVLMCLACRSPARRFPGGRSPRPARSSCFARASTSNADSVPSRAIRGATFMGFSFMVDSSRSAYYTAWTSRARPGRVSSSDGLESGHPCERPAYVVWVDAFLIARTPVTNEELAAYLAATERAACRRSGPIPRFADPLQPVVGLLVGRGPRVRGVVRSAGCRPRRSGARRARGGLDDARYPWGDTKPRRHVLSARPGVGETPANPLGLHGLSGACHEWCSDWFDEAYYQARRRWNPRGPQAGTRRVSRGGAWRHADP